MAWSLDELGKVVGWSGDDWGTKGEAHPLSSRKPRLAKSILSFLCFLWMACMPALRLLATSADRAPGTWAQEELGCTGIHRGCMQKALKIHRVPMKGILKFTNAVMLLDPVIPK